MKKFILFIILIVVPYSFIFGGNICNDDNLLYWKAYNAAGTQIAASQNYNGTYASNLDGIIACWNALVGSNSTIRFVMRGDEAYDGDIAGDNITINNGQHIIFDTENGYKVGIGGCSANSFCELYAGGTITIGNNISAFHTNGHSFIGCHGNSTAILYGELVYCSPQYLPLWIKSGATLTMPRYHGFDSSQGYLEGKSGDGTLAETQYYAVLLDPTGHTLIQNGGFEDYAFWDINAGKYDTQHIRSGNKAFKVTGNNGSSETVFSNSAGATLTQNHIYYSRIYGYQETKTNGNVSCYWPIAEPNMGQVAIGNAGQWNLYSFRSSRTNWSSGNNTFRYDFDNNGNAGEIWFDDALIIDLTEIFGAGNEPDKATCDALFSNNINTGERKITVGQNAAMPSITPPTRTDMTFCGYYDGKNGTGTKYYNADGTSAKNWDKNSVAILYAHWKINEVYFDEPTQNDWLNNRQWNNGSWSHAFSDGHLIGTMVNNTGSAVTPWVSGAYLGAGTPVTWSCYAKINTGTLTLNNFGYEKGCWKTVTLTNQWQKITYTGTTTDYAYNAFTFYENIPNGITLYVKDISIKLVGSNAMSPSWNTPNVHVRNGYSMPVIDKPTRLGYDFGGYYDGQNGTGTQYYDANGSGTRNWNKTTGATLYGKWTAHTETVSFQSFGGEAISSKSVTFGSPYGTLTTPSKTGFTFAGWYTEDTFVNQVTSTTKVAIDGNHTLYAKWNINFDAAEVVIRTKWRKATTAVEGRDSWEAGGGITLDQGGHLWRYNVQGRQVEGGTGYPLVSACNTSDGSWWKDEDTSVDIQPYTTNYGGAVATDTDGKVWYSFAGFYSGLYYKDKSQLICSTTTNDIPAGSAGRAFHGWWYGGDFYPKTDRLGYGLDIIKSGSTYYVLMSGGQHDSQYASLTTTGFALGTLTTSNVNTHNAIVSWKAFVAVPNCGCCVRVRRSRIAAQQNSFWIDGNGDYPKRITLTDWDGNNTIKTLSQSAKNSLRKEVATDVTEFNIGPHVYLVMGKSSSFFEGNEGKAALFHVTSWGDGEIATNYLSTISLPDASGGNWGRIGNYTGITSTDVEVIDNGTDRREAHIFLSYERHGIWCYIMEETPHFGITGTNGLGCGISPDGKELSYIRQLTKKNATTFEYTADVTSNAPTFQLYHKNVNNANWSSNNKLTTNSLNITEYKGFTLSGATGTPNSPDDTTSPTGKLWNLTSGDKVRVTVEYVDNLTQATPVKSYKVWFDKIQYRLASVGTNSYYSNISDCASITALSVYNPTGNTLKLQQVYKGVWSDVSTITDAPTNNVVQVAFTFGETPTVGTKSVYSGDFYIGTTSTKLNKVGATNVYDYYTTVAKNASVLTHIGNTPNKRQTTGSIDPGIAKKAALTATVTEASLIRYAYNSTTNSLQVMQIKKGEIKGDNSELIDTLTATNSYKGEVESKSANHTAAIRNYLTKDNGFDDFLFNYTVLGTNNADGKLYHMKYDFTTNALTETPYWLVPDSCAYQAASNDDIDNNYNLVISDTGKIAGTVANVNKITLEKHLALSSTSATKRNQWISLPFPVKVGDITGSNLINGGTSYSLQDTYNGAWRISYYDTEARGDSNTYDHNKSIFFKSLAKTDTMQTGIGYLLQFANGVQQDIVVRFPSNTATNTINNSNINAKTLTSTQGNVVNKNWWLIGQPYFTHTTMNTGPQYIVKMVGGNDHYEYWLWFESESLKVYESFFVQFSGNLAYTSQATNASSAPLQKTVTSVEDKEYYLLALSNQTLSRRIGVILSDNGSNDYVENRDMIQLGDKGIIQFYSISHNHLIFNDLKKQSQSISLGYATQSAGQFTIRLTNKTLFPDDSRVSLLDKTNNTTTDLLLSDYQFTSETGTFDNRFILNINKTTTSVTQPVNLNMLVWQENQTLIVENLPNDEPVMLYHVSGKLIEVKKPILGKMTFTNLTDGIYILATPTERIKIVIK